jgi:hypothetical protein
MVALRTFWLSLPDVARQVVAALTGIASGIVLIGMVLNIPARLSGAEAANRRQDSEILDLQAQARQSEYLFCVDLADRGLTPKTAQDCFQEYVQRTVR